MPFDPSQLPDLADTPESPEERLKRAMDQLAGLLGPQFSFKGGLQYQNGDFTGRLNNRGVQFKYPLGGGLLSGGVSDIGSGDPYYRLKYIKNFK